MDERRLSAESTLEYEVDPVCLTNVEVTQAREHDLVLEFAQRQYVFCSTSCRRRFADAPALYAISGRREL